MGGRDHKMAIPPLPQFWSKYKFFLSKFFFMLTIPWNEKKLIRLESEIFSPPPLPTSIMPNFSTWWKQLKGNEHMCGLGGGGWVRVDTRREFPLPLSFLLLSLLRSKYQPPHPLHSYYYRRNPQSGGRISAALSFLFWPMGGEMRPLPSLTSWKTSPPEGGYPPSGLRVPTSTPNAHIRRIQK